MRNKFVETALSYKGRKESDGGHKEIIDIYNEGRPKGAYKMTYEDAWCATYVSAMAIKAGVTDIIPIECGCERMIELFKKAGNWVENDSYTPKSGDIIFYDWQDKGVGDNKGWSDHVGIVVDVIKDRITVIEGNYSNSVKTRSLSVNGKYIRGYGVPKFEEEPVAKPAIKEPEQATVNEFKVGDKVYFTGCLHYTNSGKSATARACKAGLATITKEVKGAVHPYHLVRVSGKGSTVYGWVNESDVKAL